MAPIFSKFLKTKAAAFLFIGLFLSVGSVVAQDSITKVLVLSYDEFGPQVAAYKLIGFQWYQWNSHGDNDPNKTDDIKVVVYRKVSIRQVKKMFPVNRQKKTDHRYLRYTDALRYLEKHENEPYLEHLHETKKKIINALGAKK